MISASAEWSRPAASSLSGICRVVRITSPRSADAVQELREAVPLLHCGTPEGGDHAAAARDGQSDDSSETEAGARRSVCANLKLRVA